MADEWFYERRRENFGPISAEEIKRLRSEGEINPSTLIWKTGEEQWRPLHEWDEFKTSGSAPPPKPIRHITINSFIIGAVLTMPIMEYVIVPFTSSIFAGFMAGGSGDGFLASIISDFREGYLYEEIASHWLWLFVYVAVYSVFCTKDEEVLDKEIGPEDHMATSSWAKYVVPVYVFHRAQRILKMYPKAHWIEVHWVTIAFALSVILGVR